MNFLGEAWSYELLRCLARDWKSTTKFHYTMFSQELIWRREICYTTIVVLKMRSEDTLLQQWCISLCFNSVTHQHFFLNLNMRNLSHKLSKQSMSFLCRRWLSTNLTMTMIIIIATNDSENWLSLYADWLRSIFYCYLVTFRKPFW